MSDANLTEPPSVEPPGVELPTDHLTQLSYYHILIIYSSSLQVIFNCHSSISIKVFLYCNSINLNIALQLGLAKHTLDSISRNRSLHDDGDYYREMLTSWMHGGQATMEELVEVLKGPTVGMEDVAKHVDSERC